MKNSGVACHLGALVGARLVGNCKSFDCSVSDIRGAFIFFFGKSECVDDGVALNSKPDIYWLEANNTVNLPGERGVVECAGVPS